MPTIQPFQFIHPQDMIHTLSGKFYSVEDLGGHDLSHDPIVCVVPIRRKRFDKQALAQSQRFSLHYIPQQIAIPMTEDLGIGLDDPYDPQKSDDAEDKRTAKRLGPIYEHFRGTTPSHAEVTEEIRRHMQGWFDKLKPPSIVQFRGGRAEKLIADIENHSLEEALGAHCAVGHEDGEFAQRSITGAFHRLPEWLQLAVHEHGAFIATAAHPRDENRAHGAAFNRLTLHHPNSMLIYVKPYREQEETLETLREETLHQLQEITDSDAALALRDDIPIDDFEQQLEKVIGPRWFKAAAALIEQIDAAPESSKALNLIKHTEPHGGSLMSKRLQEKRHDNMYIRSCELLVDICDAEIYLRRDAGKSAEEAEAMLIDAFGNDVYAISREYVKIWMDKATAQLTQTLGPEKAADFRKKWEKDPFTHTITLDKLPEYRFGGQGRGV